MGIEGMYLNIMKAIYAKSTAKIILNSEKLKVFQEQGKDAHSHHFHSTVLELLATAIKEKEIKRIQAGKEEVKLFLFADDMILLYTENPKDVTKNSYNTSMNLVKLQDMKLTQRHVLHTSNEPSEKLSKQFIYNCSKKN